MIRLLAAIFLSMFAYGLWVNVLGAAFLSLGMFLFTWWADRKFAEQDKAYAADPRNARPLESPTSDALAKHDAECMRTEL